MNTSELLLPVAAQNHQHQNRHARTVHNKSSSSLRKKSDVIAMSKVRWNFLRNILANLQEIFLGTKLFLLFPFIPLAIIANLFNFGSAWLFVFSMIGLIPLAERLSFLTEQITYFTGPTVGGLLNATCGNATELIIALFALHQGKISVVKSSLVGSILSNLLLVLGSSLLLGGLANLSTNQEQFYNRKQADVSMGLLLLGVLCHLLPVMLRHSITGSSEIAMDVASSTILRFSRFCSVMMLIVYVVYIFFQLKTHREIFETEDNDDDENDDVSSDDIPVIGFGSGIAWLVGITVVVAILSEYIVATIEEASNTWGLSVSFISVILLPIVGNAAEHAGAVIFAWKNKLDITLGISLGSAAQISVFVVPLSVVLAWMMGIPMDLDFNFIETGSLLLSVLLTAFALQDGTSHYFKGLVLLITYFVIAACFFVLKTPLSELDDSK
ncbi:Vacuolar cation/proton exchanger 3 [Zostera marina]|uniref:Vacuolar cation/proton exchanger n=1 Tax=Zostera marina TaxID=29655 RepID=A0A0K9PBS2_ZOSMR|nr:Vacuolar cation/proton exchanger 3 [Zostera marina]